MVLAWVETRIDTLRNQQFLRIKKYKSLTKKKKIKNFYFPSFKPELYSFILSVTSYKYIQLLT